MSDRTIIAIVCIGCFTAVFLVVFVLFMRRDVNATFSLRFGARKVETSIVIEQDGKSDPHPRSNPQ